jgi:BolA protein
MTPKQITIMKVSEEMSSALMAEFAPSFLQVENESHRHNVPPNSETHFKVTLVSESFAGQRSVKRHQAVYRVLADWLADPVHALALHTYTAIEWESREGAPDSPDCRGGTGL